jgi:hypothetical protein
MTEKIRNFVYITFGLVVFLCILLLSFKILVHAETVTTSVTVGNSAPSFTAGPAESTASDGTSPTNEGSNVVFQATATDSNAEDYYLAICKTDSVTAGVAGAAPTCAGGNWCITTATDSGVQASCSYTTLDGDAQSNDWYAFVCDNNSSSASCSTPGNIGSGGTGSPFKVNHDPAFSAVVDNGGGGADSGADPGGTITFTTTASDGDNDTVQDTVKLVVCADTSGATAAGCAGTQICASSNTGSNPSCQLSIAAVVPDDTINYYAYVFDSHSFGSSSNYRTGAYVINNTAPVVSSVTLNGAANISVPEGATSNVSVTATVEDNNSCQDLTTVETGLYRSAIGYGGCDANAEDNNNYCYAQVSCSVVGGTCTGATDDFANYTCTVVVQYHADPTDANSQYPAQNWLNTVKAIDDDTASHAVEVSAGVEVESLAALDVTGSINYGSLNVGQKNDPLDKITVVSATGNVGIDSELSGTNMTDGGSGVIGVGYQKHALAGSTAYASGTVLTGTSTQYELNVLKTTVTGSPATKNIWWGLEVPTGIPPGIYSGQNTVLAYLGELIEW